LGRSRLNQERLAAGATPARFYGIGLTAGRADKRHASIIIREGRVINWRLPLIMTRTVTLFYSSFSRQKKEHSDPYQSQPTDQRADGKAKGLKD
jgi:hypothetical protein